MHSLGDGFRQDEERSPSPLFLMEEGAIAPISNDEGEPEDNFVEPPDWTIEILSPEQKANRVIDNILHCLRHGCQLGWLIDPDERSILTFRLKQEPEVYRESDRQILAQVSLPKLCDRILHACTSS